MLIKTLRLCLFTSLRDLATLFIFIYFYLFLRLIQEA